MSNLSLLVIEDEIELLTIYYELSNEIFDTVFVASTLTEAREIIKREWIDGILLDNHLPDGKGLELLYELNSEEFNYPSIVITAHADNETLLDALDCAVHKLIPKPIRISKLEEVLINFKKYISNHKSDIELKSRFVICEETLKSLQERFSLSTRELSVIKHSLHVENNGKLAKLLFISPATIKRHWQNIFAKMNLRSRKEIISYISHSNLLSYHKTT